MTFNSRQASPAVSYLYHPALLITVLLDNNMKQLFTHRWPERSRCRVMNAESGITFHFSALLIFYMHRVDVHRVQCTGTGCALFFRLPNRTATRPGRPRSKFRHKNVSWRDFDLVSLQPRFRTCLFNRSQLNSRERFSTFF